MVHGARLRISRCSVRLGGLIGCGWSPRFPERFARVVAAIPAAGRGEAPLAFKLWVAFSQMVPRFPVDAGLEGHGSRLTAAEKSGL